MIVPISRISHLLRTRASQFFGLNQEPSAQAGRGTRIGLFVSGAFLVAVGLLIVLISSLFVVLAIPVFLFGAYNLVNSRRKILSLSRSNLLSLSGHLCATVVLYLLFTRILWVTYMTDSIVGSYMGVLKVLALQNPYGYSIKPFLDHFSFPPSFYTPRIDGSFEFHLNYPALNFLTLLPLYAAGLHDLRDGVFIFHILSVLLIFGLVPSRQKALSLAPFVFFPAFVAASWTDSVWAFFLVGGAILWYRNRNLGLLMVGFAGATKQIALIAAPFLLIRLWQESPGSKLRNTLVGAGAIATGFLGPNIPFMLSSPSQWWAATIAPYFPGGAAQVPGGVGLSGVLLDLGVVPPPLFFVALMSLVGVGALYLYSTRFSKSRYFVWIFPIMIMFFYYRSFPNYIFYWAFPLAYEFFNSRPALSIWHFSPFHTLPWHPSVGPTLRSVRSRLRVPLLAGLLLTTVFVGAFGTYVSNSPPSRVDVQINSIVDPDGIGASTLLNVTLDNLTPRPIVPSFFVKWSYLPYLWASDSNQSLAPSSSASYLVSATDGLAAVPRSTSFRVYVFDAGTRNLVGQSLPFRIDSPLPTIENPHFRWWTLDVGAGAKVPFSWKLTKANIDSLTPVIQGLDHNQTSGISLRLNYTSPAINVEKIMLSQKIFLNSTTMNLSLFDPAATSTGNRAVLGVTLTDGAHELSYIFSNTTAKSTLFTSSYNITNVVPVAASAWTTVFIDANQAWLAQGWAVPNQVTFTIFLQANSAGLYSASIRDLSYPVSGQVSL
ncbi:hypothetical protein E6H32_07765 [Candidatus Bathyarchaeota archaeon]|nr:MAG: hypothetical protein E6H32_07765 [Candidatus Bathyarchaeota archaeon]